VETLPTMSSCQALTGPVESSYWEESSYPVESFFAKASLKESSCPMESSSPTESAVHMQRANGARDHKRARCGDIVNEEFERGGDVLDEERVLKGELLHDGKFFHKDVVEVELASDGESSNLARSSLQGCRQLRARTWRRRARWRARNRRRV